MTTLNRICLISALAIGAIGMVSLAVAQTGVLPGQSSLRFGGVLEQAQDQGTKSDETGGRNRQLESILGRDIRTRGEEDMGRIIDVLADRNGQVQAAVVELGGFLGIGTRRIAVEWSALTFDSKGKQPQIILEMGRDQLRLAPEYKPNEPMVMRRVVDY